MRKRHIALYMLVNIFFIHSFAQGYATYIVVAKDGSGNFTSIQKAVESCKAFPDQRITIFIKNGIYKEKVQVPAWNTCVSFIGQNRDSTIIVSDDYFKKINKGPNSTFYTATLQVCGNDFHVENLTVENNAGPVGQAIALDMEADRCSVVHCNITGNQDALYTAGENARQYFKDCRVTGTTDFIFGAATALFDSCTIICKTDSYITAASTPKSVLYGYVFRDCTIKAAGKAHKVYLGRPWRKYAKTVFINCRMGEFIAPAGWMTWSNAGSEQTVFYAEYGSKGTGTSERISWSHQLTKEQAGQYTVQNIFRRWSPLK